VGWAVATGGVWLGFIKCGQKHKEGQAPDICGEAERNLDSRDGGGGRAAVKEGARMSQSRGPIRVLCGRGLELAGCWAAGSAYTKLMRRAVQQGRRGCEAKTHELRVRTDAGDRQEGDGGDARSGPAGRRRAADRQRRG
jgi:hypothetical protein